MALGGRHFRCLSNNQMGDGDDVRGCVGEEARLGRNVWGGQLPVVWGVGGSGGGVSATARGRRQLGGGEAVAAARKRDVGGSLAAARRWRQRDSGT